MDTTPGFDPGAGPRHVLTRWGADVLAARDGVPLHRYLAEAPIAAEGPVAGARGDRATPVGSGPGASGEVRLRDARRRPAHTMGVQDFVRALAREAAREWARGRDHRLLVWLNPVEAGAWFRHAGGVGHIWPDARVRYLRDGVIHDLLLEWDRGLVRRREYARKFAAYAAHVTAVTGSGTTGHARGHERPTPGAVTRLVVVTTPSALMRVRAALAAAAAICPRLGELTRVITMDVVAEARVMATLAIPTAGTRAMGAPAGQR